ncbi:MAG: hypothetical protein HYZ53_27435 [Planctomycetes bacterium]|nr:hypothetical protein [Planctomycetota bacterium]
MPRFVIQEHFTTPHHFDLMLEHGGALATWSVSEAPALAPGAALEATRREDHRLAYLDYEGEVSGGRGHVRIWARGEYDAEAWSDAEVRLAARSEQWPGSYRLVATQGVRAGRPLWVLRRETGDPGV